MKAVVKRVSCRSCGGSSIKISGLSAYDISYVCRCGEFTRLMANEKELKDGKVISACRDGDKVFCPACREELMCFDGRYMRGIAFVIKCSCGRIYNAQREIIHRERKIGTFASYEDAENGSKK